MPKKRILLVNESSHGVYSGFSKIGYELMTRLWNTGKYELAEIANYVQYNDPKLLQAPWSVYPSTPKNEEEEQKYREADPYSQFGSWLFEDVCLDFLPDIVWTITDHWMGPEWILKSPFRDKFKYCAMPTLDGEPQRVPWLEDYEEVDTLLTYTDYGKRTLEREAPNLKVDGVVRPGVDPNKFQEKDKSQLRQKFGLHPDWNIVLTTMRNQRRKLFPDLFDAFNEYLDKCHQNNNEDLANKTFLYLHTSYPDVGFDIGRLLMEKGLSHKVLMTYKCAKCGAYYPSFFETEMTMCKSCENLAAHLPNTTNGLSEDELVDIFNLADIYVQYSICISPYTDIRTVDKYKKAHSVQLQDQVLTHQNRYKHVTNIQRNKSTKHSYQIKLQGHEGSVELTDDHEIYILEEYDKPVESTKHANPIIKPTEKDIRCGNKKAKDLSEDDFVLISKDDRTIDIDYLPHTSIRVDDTIATFLGMTALDSPTNIMNDYFVRKKDVFNQVIQDTSKLICGDIPKYKFNEEYTRYKPIFDDSIKTILGNIKDKNQFTDILSNSNDKIQYLFMFGLLMRYGQYVVYYRTSKEGYKDYTLLNLSYGNIEVSHKICNILQRLNVAYDVQYINGYVELYIYAQFLFNKLRHIEQSHVVYKYGYMWRKVSEIKYLGEKRQTWYNFEVEDDNSYATISGTVHNCEGLGMGSVEARSCGIPILTVNYSASEDQAQEPGSSPIEVEKFFYETVMETEQMRALPNNSDFADKLYQHLILPKNELRQKGLEGQKYVRENYSFDRSAKIYENVFDNLKVYDHQDTWFSPENNFCPMSQDFPEFQNNSHLVDWCIDNILGQPKLKNTYWRNLLIKSLNVGYMPQSSKHQAEHKTMNPKSLINMMLQRAQKHNECENRRLNKLVKSHDNRLDWATI